MRVHTAHLGSGASEQTPSIIATPGIGKTSECWKPLAAELAGHFAITAWDLMGHGQSPIPDDPAEYTRDRALEDIDDIIAAGSTPDEPPILLGHSLGGYLTLAWAATRPVLPKAMILLATGPGFRDAEKREAWNARSRRNAHRFGVPPQAAELNLQADGIVMEKVPSMDVPTLCMVGSEDRPELQGGSSYLAAKLPNASLITVDGGDHNMHESPEYTPMIAQAIIDFLTSLDA